MPPKQVNWFRLALQLRGSVIPAVLPRVALCGIFGLFLSILSSRGLILGGSSLGGAIPSIVLGLLLVFRTNTAYERFWEGRKAWGELVNVTRNLARQIWVFVEEPEEHDRQGKVAILHLLVAFATATKLHLRQEPPNHELKPLILEHQFQALTAIQNPPLQIAVWIEDYLQQQYKLGRVYIYQLTLLNTFLGRMVDVLGACERILKTPMPLAYAIHLKQLLLLYCLLLGFQFVGELGLWTGPVVAIISFALFGIEEIGLEIENPFGYDLNDLPLDTICNTMLHNIEDLIQTTPQAHGGCKKQTPPGLETDLATYTTGNKVEIVRD
jgi:ion channel-forming bestrophin family protein